jgi:hypothetical protein
MSLIVALKKYRHLHEYLFSKKPLPLFSTVRYMERDLVEERAWITQEEYNAGFTLAQLTPGPLAAQLAIYLGWVKYLKHQLQKFELIRLYFEKPKNHLYFAQCIGLALTN